MSCWQLAVDWSAIGGLLSGVAALVLAMTGAWGVATWRSTNFRKGQYEAALHCLDSAMAYGELLRKSADVFNHRDLWAEVPRFDNESEQDWMYRRHLFLPQVIVSKSSSVTFSMRESIHKARAWLDKETSDAIRDLFEYQYQIYEDFRSAWMLGQDLQRSERDEYRNEARIAEIMAKIQISHAHLLRPHGKDAEGNRSGLEIKVGSLEDRCSELLSRYVRRSSFTRKPSRK